MDCSFSADIQTRIDNKTKPLGALGLLEKVALQLALIQSQDQTQAVEEIVIRSQRCWCLLATMVLRKKALASHRVKLPSKWLQTSLLEVRQLTAFAM